MKAVARKGLFVDLDGTLADNLTALKAAYFAFLADFGVMGSEAEFAKLNGPPLIRVVEMLKVAHGLPADLADLTERYSGLARALYETAPPRDGGRLLLESARRGGWQVAIVTSAPRGLASAWLSRNDLSGQVDAVVGGDEVASGKPAPDSYQLALARVGCAADISLAIEDSPAGAMSAVDAGIACCVLAEPASRCGWPRNVRFIDRLSDVMGML
jgi:HAD superfamily hydrolase (TIGR01509 family)